MHLFQQIPHKHITGIANASMIKGIPTKFINLTSPNSCKDATEQDRLFIIDTKELSWQTAERLKCKTFILDAPVPKFAETNSLFKTLELPNVADTLRFPSGAIKQKVEPPFYDRTVTYIHSGLDKEVWGEFLENNPAILCFGHYIKSYGYLGAVDSVDLMSLCSGATYMSLDNFLVPELQYYKHPLIVNSKFEQIESSTPTTYQNVLETLIYG